MPKYCAYSTVSIALTAKRFGYSLHGHDVMIRVCIKSNELIDLSTYSRLIRDISSKYDHRFLDDMLGEGAMVEDLLVEILKKVRVALAKSGISYKDLWCEARIPDGDIIVSVDEMPMEG